LLLLLLLLCLFLSTDAFLGSGGPGILNE
jgi:hypothetical protein